MRDVYGSRLIIIQFSIGPIALKFNPVQPAYQKHLAKTKQSCQKISKLYLLITMVKQKTSRLSCLQTWSLCPYPWIQRKMMYNFPIEKTLSLFQIYWKVDELPKGWINQSKSYWTSSFLAYESQKNKNRKMNKRKSTLLQWIFSNIKVLPCFNNTNFVLKKSLQNVLPKCY